MAAASGQAVVIAPGEIGFVVGDAANVGMAFGEAVPVAYPPNVLPPGQDQRFGAAGQV